MKARALLLPAVAATLVATTFPADAFMITAGEYRFVVAEAYTQLVDPYDLNVAGELFQGNQWAVARINEMQKKNAMGLYDTIWSAGQLLPEPPLGTTDRYMTAVLGGLTLQPDARPAALGLPGAANTGMTYNIRQHPVTGGGLAHPDDYVDSTPGPGELLPQNSYWISDTVNGTGTAYLKLFGNANNIFNADVAAGIGVGGGAFGSFAPNTIGGTLLMDGLLDPVALLSQEGAIGDSISTGADGILGTADDTLGQLRAIFSSDTETGINAFWQTTGAGAWDALFDSNSPDFFGADGSLQFTARVMDGSPYFMDPLGEDEAQTAFGWDYRDVGDADTQVPPGMIPEPSTIVLLGMGLAALGAATRRRATR